MMRSFLSLVAQVIDIYNLKIAGDWRHFKRPQGRQSSSPVSTPRRSIHSASISSKAISTVINSEPFLRKCSLTYPFFYTYKTLFCYPNNLALMVSHMLTCR